MITNVFDNPTNCYLAGYAYDHDISYIVQPLSLDTPSSSNTENRTVLINNNVSDPNRIPLFFAHEIGHVLNGDRGVQYFCMNAKYSPTEVNASRTGIKILSGYYFNDVPLEEWNIDRFFDYYKIEPSYYDWFQEYLSEKFNRS